MKSSLDANYVRINGINIRYIDQNQNQEPVIFIHGLGGSGSGIIISDRCHHEI